MKYKNMSLLIGLIIILLAATYSYSDMEHSLDWLTREEQDWLKAHPVIEYSYDPDFAPFEFVEDGKPKGMYVDVLNKVAEELGVEFEMVYLGSWGEVIQGLSDKKTDLISASPTDERRKTMHFSEVYISVPTGIIIREGDTSIKDFNDLNGRRISTVKGWSWNEVLSLNHPEYKLVTYDTIEESLNAIVYGDVDATILDYGTASYHIGNSKISSLKVLTKYNLTQDVAYAVREDYEILVSILDKTIPRIEKEISLIQSDWIRLDVEAINNYDFLIRVVLIGLLVLALLFFWSISLKSQVSKKTKALQDELEKSQDMQEEIAQINQKLHQSEREIRAILDAVPSAIFVLDRQGRYTVANATAARTFGTSIKNMLGKTAYDFSDNISSGGIDAIKEVEEKLFKGEMSQHVYSLELNDGKGNHFIHEVKKLPVLDEAGHPEFLVTIGSDITEIYEKNQALQHSISELKEAKNKLLEQERWAAIGAFVAGIAHDINTPLGSSITINSHLIKLLEDSRLEFDNGTLKRSQLVELYNEASESTRMLDAHLTQAAELIQNFKAVSVRQINEVEESYDLGDFINKIAVGLKYECKIKGVNIKVKCPEKITLKGTPGHVSQVFTNLISNSLKHGYDGKSGGTINIGLTNGKEQIHIRYQDDGIGMTEDVLSEVFKPFYTTKKDQGGSGLGMHIVQTIISENLQGSIEMSSKYGEGVQFDIFLPK